jgi:polysaccharide biosynthesis protein PslA
MTKQVKQGILYYLLADYISAAIAWILFVVFRKSTGEQLALQDAIQNLSSKDWINALLFVPSFWLILYHHCGSYFNIYRKSRLSEIVRTLISTLLGVLIIFFVTVVNDKVHSYAYFSQAFFFLWILQFIVTSIGRSVVLQKAKSDIHNKRFSFTTLVVGSDTEAERLYAEVHLNKAPLPNKIVGYVSDTKNSTGKLLQQLPYLGQIKQLEEIVHTHDVHEVLIAIETDQHHQLQDILTALSYKATVIKISPDLYDIISGSVKTSNVLGAVLIEIYPELMPDWQRVIKRSLDISVSLLVMISCAPLYLYTALRVRLSSGGPIIYQQERIGLYGAPFKILKFRSMYSNSEKAGPALSQENDPRVTPWGRIMRKWRLDEIPQFYNVLKGEMSLVGPRPERKYFVEQICKTHPHYKYLHKVKPGLSSWGMVKYGYASNIDEMKERMRYDLLYIKNCSLVLDTKIMFYTLLVILQGRGK